jgi:hypothetical protein
MRAKVLATLGTTAERLVEQADNSCVVCLSAMVANVALTPCGARLRGAASASQSTLMAAAGHVGFCDQCARKVASCPICNKAVAAVLVTYKS